MKRKILLTTDENHVLTSILENDEIVEIHCEKKDNHANKYRLGDIYLGKVKNIIPGIQAAFIEISKGIEGYYPFESTPPHIGDELVVQIKKEASKNKVATVTSNWSLPGRFAVLTPGENRIGTSTKIPENERAQLAILAHQHLTADYGFILRTNAAQVPWKTVEEELLILKNQYQIIQKTKDKRVCYSCLYRVPPDYISVISNMPLDGLEEILVEDIDLYETLAAYFTNHHVEDLKRLRKYVDKLLPLHKRYRLEHVLEDALKEKIWLKSGAYLTIQSTEACTVIDVNTGKAVKKGDAAFKINLEAAKEIARQLRLRNLSGIILVDFINLPKETELEALLKEFQHFLKCDPIQTTLVDVTKLQLIEVTRKKIRKPLAESLKNYD